MKSERRELLSAVSVLTRHFRFTNYRIFRLFSQRNALIFVRGVRRDEPLTDREIDNMVLGMRLRPTEHCYACDRPYPQGTATEATS